MTMLMVTHQMQFAREFANRVIFMEHGIILEEGTPEKYSINPRRNEPKLSQNCFGNHLKNNGLTLEMKALTI